MRDRDDGALVVSEEALEPAHRFRIEVVRRLVEQQQVRRGEKEPAEGDPPPLAPRERRHVAVAVGQAQRVHRAVQRCFERPAVAAVDLLLHLRLLDEQRIEIGVGLGEAPRDGLEAVEQVADTVLNAAAHVLHGIELGLLLEQPHRRARRELRLAARRLLVSGHDTQQGRLPRPVRPQNTDLRPKQEGKGDVHQHLAIRPVELVGPIH